MHRASVRSVLTAASTVGLLVCGSLVGQTASAAPGDVVEFALPSGASQPQALATDSTGTLWLALRGTGVLAKVAMDGTVTTVINGAPAANTGPAGLALGSDKRMWFTEDVANRVSAATTAGALQSFPLPNASSSPRGITPGPDNNLWFTEFSGNRIGRITTAGSITEFSLPIGSAPSGITAGPDGALWFTMSGANAIGRVTTAGVISTFPLPTADSVPTGIVTGPDNNLWFTEFDGNRIGRITPAGLVAEFTLPNPASQPNQITVGPDRNLWFTETGGNRVGRITTAGSISEFVAPTGASRPTGISAAADGNVWFTEFAANRIARVLTGVVPVSTAAPVITGPGTAVGQTLTASTGSWSSSPTSFTYQWQRCATADASSCAAISGATGSTYVVASADSGQRVRVVVNATNLNGSAVAAAPSALLTIGGLPPAPPPVAGGQVVTLAPGITATLKGPTSPRRKALNNYSVRVNSRAVKGKVRISIVNSVGQEIRVLAVGKAIGPAGLARRSARVTIAVAPGPYTLRAIFTPRADQVSMYPVATMTKPIYVRR